MIKEISSKEARARGYKPLAGPYDLAAPEPQIRRQENQFWRNVCKDMSKCNAVAVAVDEGLMEIWRHESELTLEEDQP